MTKDIAHKVQRFRMLISTDPQLCVTGHLNHLEFFFVDQGVGITLGVVEV